MFFEFFGLPENKPIMKEYEMFSLYGPLKNSSAHEDHSCLNKRSKFDHLIYLLIYNRVVDKMKVVYPFYESVIIKKPKKVNV